HMDASTSRYEHFNETGSRTSTALSAVMRFCSRVCVSTSGTAGNAARCVAALFSVYVIGYLTGYYIHRCS
uniref:Uncharacterized protein n=1 Tax=Gouania willdenowi TaxID=441366 RepID=A0A8C5G364_GOUWI